MTAHETKGSSNRVFGLVFTAFFALLSALSWYRGRWEWPWALGFAATFLVLALAWPSSLTMPNRLWTRFGLLLHRIVSPVVLMLMFFLVISPYGLLMRLFRKDPLKLEIRKDLDSYWIARTPPGPDPRTMDKQF